MVSVVGMPGVLQTPQISATSPVRAVERRNREQRRSRPQQRGDWQELPDDDPAPVHDVTASLASTLTTLELAHLSEEPQVANAADRPCGSVLRAYSDS